jgi:hypothetical protein
MFVWLWLIIPTLTLIIVPWKKHLKHPERPFFLKTLRDGIIISGISLIPWLFIIDFKDVGEFNDVFFFSIIILLYVSATILTPISIYLKKWIKEFFHDFK